LKSTIRGVVDEPERYVSPVSKPYYDTVWGFLSKYEPHTLELMLDPVGSLRADEDIAILTAEALGQEYHKVPAPPALQEAGITEVLAFPLWVLHEVFPTNP